LLYDLKLLDQDLPFLELRKLSRINGFANGASADDLGEAIRRGLPGYERPAALNTLEVEQVGSHRA
jgi:hypothetical protein